MKQTQESPPLGTSNEANLRLASAENHDLEAAQPISPFSTSTPPGHIAAHERTGVLGGRTPSSGGRKSHRDHEISERRRSSAARRGGKLHRNASGASDSVSPQQSQELSYAMDRYMQEPASGDEGWLEEREEVKTRSAEFQESQAEAAEHNSGKQESPTRGAAKTEGENFSIKIQDLERKIAEMREAPGEKAQDLSNADLRVEQAEEHYEASNEHLRKFRQYIEDLWDLVDQNAQSTPEIPDGTRGADWNPLKNHMESVVNLDPYTDALHSKLLPFVHRFDDTTQLLRNKNTELTKLLSDKDRELTIVEAVMSAQAKRNDAEQSGEKAAWQTDKDTFEKLFYEERERRKAAEERFQKFKATAEKWYQPDLERKNRELHIDLTHAQDDNMWLRDKVKKHQARAQQWENEYSLAQSELETRTVGFEERIREQQNEMLGYIKEYHDKTLDPEHWEIEGLQKTVKTLEKDLVTTNELFGQTKIDKARLEDEIRRLMDTNKRTEKYAERLGKAWITGAAAPTLFDSASSDSGSGGSSSDASSSSSPRWLTHPRKVDDGRKIPRCHLPKAIEQREVIMVEFRKEQQKKRDAQDALDEIMEKVRKWKLGSLYPPDKARWKDLKTQDSWKIWDADRWVWTEASLDDQKVVLDLREKGLLMPHDVWLKQLSFR